MKLDAKGRNIHIENSFTIWSTHSMWSEIIHRCHLKYGSTQADVVLNRTYNGMYIEWWIHNIGYYLTLPFVKNPRIKQLNKRFKDVDIEGH